MVVGEFFFSFFFFNLSVRIGRMPLGIRIRNDRKVDSLGQLSTFECSHKEA